MAATVAFWASAPFVGALSGWWLAGRFLEKAQVR